MRKKLLIEALGIGNDSGIGKMTRHWLQILGNAGLESHWDFYVLSRFKSHPAIPKHAKCITVRAKPYFIWLNLLFPILLYRLRPHTVVCLGQSLVRFRPSARYFLFIQDMGPLERLSFRTSLNESRNKRDLQQMIPRADKLLTCAEFNKKRIVSLLHLDPNKIVVLPLVLKKQGHALPPELNSKDRPIPKDFIFSFGNIEPRKNYPLLVEAYALALKEDESLPQLIIAGHKAWAWQELHATLSRLNLGNKVQVWGRITENTLMRLRQECSFFVTASLYEGFGLPLYEALLDGRPSIYHILSCQHEFAADFALGIDCREKNALSEALLYLWQSPNKRQQMSTLLQAFPLKEEKSMTIATQALLGN